MNFANNSNKLCKFNIQKVNVNVFVIPIKQRFLSLTHSSKIVSLQISKTQFLGL